MLMCKNKVTILLTFETKALHISYSRKKEEKLIDRENIIREADDGKQG